MNSTVKRFVQYLNYRTVVGFVIVFLVYFVATKLSMFLHYEWETQVLILPPAGIALVAVIFGGYRMWLPIFLAQFFAVYTESLDAYPVALILASAHVFQAVISLYFLQLLKFKPSLQDSRGTFIFVGLTFIVTLIEPIITTVVQEVLYTPSLPPVISLGRGWGAGIFSMVVVAPFLLTWFNKQPRQPNTRYKKLEIAAAMLALLSVAYFLFWTNTPSYFGISTIFYLPAVLTWFALRFPVRWLTLGVLLTSIFGIAGAILSAPATTVLLNGDLLTIEIYIGLVAAIFLVFVSIVEERRAALVGLEDAYRSILAADKAKTEFIAILAHELRNPLAPLVSSAELLKQSPQTKECAKAIQSIQEHAGMMSRILDDLLDTARLSQKKFTLKTEAIELREVIDQSVQSVAGTMRARHHMLAVHVPDEEMFLYADPVRIKQVIINLLINAAKYTAPGGRINLTATRKQNYFQIEVSDNGEGIEQSMQKSIFEPFKQAGNGKHGTGLGLGLFLTKYLVEAHDGTIEVMSEGRGHGATFTVSLPLPTEIITRNKKEKRKKKTKGAGPSCILIVDDNKAAADTLALLLRHYGHTVHVAYSGMDALSSLPKVKPELILLDIGMPVMDGYAVAKEIRRRGWTGKVVALSGYGQEVDRMSSKEAGFDDHLLKPVLSSDIIAILERMNVCNEPTK